MTVKKKRNNDEHLIQSSFMSLVRYYTEKYPLLGLVYAIPNGGYRSFSEGASLKREGVLPGIPDICFPVTNKLQGSLYLEFKTIKGVVSSNQKTIIALLERANNRVEVVRSAEEALLIMEDYTGWELPWFDIKRGLPM